VSKWRAIVFDLDDTLYPERDYVLSGFRAVAAWAEDHLRIPAGQGFVELKNLFDEGVRGDTFNRWLVAHHFPMDDLVSQLVRVYRDHEPVLKPFAAVPELLSSWRGTYQLGLLSDGYLAVQQRKLAALGLGPYFDAVVFSDEWGRDAWKPSSRPFEMVLQRLGVAGFQTVYVGDNPLKDFLGARQVGIWTVRVRHPQGLYAHLEPPSPNHAPEVEINDLSGLEKILGLTTVE
jgi:putative hydrolase of the HAD superfamily